MNALVTPDAVRVKVVLDAGRFRSQPGAACEPLVTFSGTSEMAVLAVGGRSLTRRELDTAGALPS